MVKNDKTLNLYLIGFISSMFYMYATGYMKTLPDFRTFFFEYALYILILQFLM